MPTVLLFLRRFLGYQGLDSFLDQHRDLSGDLGLAPEPGVCGRDRVRHRRPRIRPLLANGPRRDLRTKNDDDSAPGRDRHLRLLADRLNLHGNYRLPGPKFQRKRALILLLEMTAFGRFLFYPQDLSTKTEPPCYNKSRI